MELTLLPAQRYFPKISHLGTDGQAYQVQLQRSEKEIWKGSCLKWQGCPLAFARWRADQHKHVKRCYIKLNIPCYAVSSPPCAPLFCIKESVLYLLRPLLKLSVLKPLLMKQTIPTPKGQMWGTWCSSAECCLFGLIRIVLKWLTPNSSCAQNHVSP